MNAELLKQARDALASCTDQKCLSTGPNSYMHVLNFDAGKVASAIAAIDAALSQPASEDAWLSGVIKQIAELPDRNSPEGQPEMMLVTAEELTSILRARPAKESGK